MTMSDLLTDATGTLRRTTASHIGLRVGDGGDAVATAAAFYGRVLGLVPSGEAPSGTAPPGGVRLGWGAGHHVLDLLPGPPGVDHIGFECRDDLDALRDRLDRAGHPVSDLDPCHVDAAVGEARGIAFTDPDGTVVHVHTAVHRLGEHTADPGRRPIRYQHVTLSTDDVAATTGFWTRVVGFTVSDRLADDRFAWLRSDRDHHTLALVNAGRGSGIDHFSFDLAQWDDFKTWCDRLADNGVLVTWGPGRHGPGNNLFVFFDDPSGHHIELSAEMERFYDDRVTYGQRVWEPVPTSVNLWGGQLASWRRTSGKD
ncbi:VOC family protein [Pseudonocardia sp. ICBG1122]|nr:VOC family protein [Pseudonocardia pini]